ncbi:MAG TPA: hypothetical protein VM846_11215 [Vicinamibacterales bacterium]|nr:hypothetical protein [Vicinamibacterales bacterium]
MRKFGWLGVVAAVFALSIYAGAPVSGQQQAMPRPYGTPPALVITAFGGKAVDYKAPRTPWGDPDLQGVWSSDNMQGVQTAGGGRGGGRGRGGPGGAAPAAAAPAAPVGPPPLYLDDAALKARQDQITAAAKRSDGAGTDGSFRFDYARRAFPQTRLLVDPPSGQMPLLNANLQSRGMPRGTYGPGPLDSWEDFSLYERCITRGIGGSILNVIYGNGNRIVQGPGVVAFSYEMLPDTRIFFTDGRPHVSQKIGMYLGNSTAKWEGEELVVETTNLTDLTAFGVNGNGTRHSKAMKITERFRRVAEDIVQYQATWDDPLTYQAPFTVSFPLTPLDGGELLPYECHAGNAAIQMSLAAEREEDKKLAADLAKGIKRERRGVQECGAGVGGAPVAGCTPGAPAAGGGRGGRGGRGGVADTGEGTREQ